MAQEAPHQSSQQDLFRAAEQVVRSGRTQAVQFQGATLSIGKLESSKPAPRRSRRENGFLAAYGSVPPLNPPLSDREMSEIATEEAAEEAARTRHSAHANA